MSDNGRRQIMSFLIILFIPAQILALVYALLVACSRVTDNKHHPGDVMAGAIMGTLLAILSLVRVREYQRMRLRLPEGQDSVYQDDDQENGDNLNLRQRSVEPINENQRRL